MTRDKVSDIIACIMAVTTVMGALITLWVVYYDGPAGLSLLLTMTIPITMFCGCWLYDVCTKEDKEDD